MPACGLHHLAQRPEGNALAVRQRSAPPPDDQVGSVARRAGAAPRPAGTCRCPARRSASPAGSKARAASGRAPPRSMSGSSSRPTSGRPIALLLGHHRARLDGHATPPPAPPCPSPPPARLRRSGSPDRSPGRSTRPPARRPPAPRPEPRGRVHHVADAHRPAARRPTVTSASPVVTPTRTCSPSSPHRLGSARPSRIARAHSAPPARRHPRARPARRTPPSHRRR